MLREEIIKKTTLKYGEDRYTRPGFTAISAQSLNIYRENNIRSDDDNINNRHDDRQQE